MKLKIMDQIAGQVFERVINLETRLASRPDVIRWTDDSPTRFEIMQETLKMGEGALDVKIGPVVAAAMSGILHSLTSLKKNPPQPQSRINQEQLEAFEAYVLSLGASSVGYTPLPARWVFQEKSVLHHNAIILAMPMDKPRIDTAPSLDAMFAVMETYRDLGKIANQAAAYLRERGFSAHAGHPLMGLALYPPLAQAAGLGWLASSGLIITPEHGPCVRLAAVFTSIENLPYGEHTDHAWVEDYCASCGVCIKKCPADAIYQEPIRHESGQITYVDNNKCFPYFHYNYGCSVCVAVCPFNHVPFEKLKAKMRHDPAFEMG